MAHDENQKLPPMINLQQCYTEKFLLDAVEARPDLIEVRWQTRVERCRGSRGRRATRDRNRAGRATRSTADWVVACDGARSVARQALGLKFHGTQYEGRYVIVDIELKSDYPTERRAWFDPPSNPGSTLLMHKQPDNIWRMDYQLRDDEDPDEAVKPENVIPRVASHLQMIGERDDWRPVWISMYKANALTLEQLSSRSRAFGRRRRASGADLRCARHELGHRRQRQPRLEARVRRQGLGERARCWTAYSEERVFAARENLRYATRSTEFMAPPSHAFELMRRAVLSLAAKHEWMRTLINPRQTSAIAFLDSRLNAFPERSKEFGAGPRPGEILPECPLTLRGGAAAFITDLLGAHFTVLYFTEAGEVPADLLRLSQRLEQGRRAVRMEDHQPAPGSRARHACDHTGRLFAMYGAQPGTLYLVRPDGHVMARWREANGEELESALEQALRL